MKYDSPFRIVNENRLVIGVFNNKSFAEKIVDRLNREFPSRRFKLIFFVSDADWEEIK